MLRSALTWSVVMLALLTMNVHSKPRMPKMHDDNPNIRHVKRPPPPPHPGRLDNPPPPLPPIETHGDTVTDDIAELQYEKYLREVTNILENDPKFKEKLKGASRDDIMSGKLADELQFSHHSVRSKLDEAKRREVDRLRAQFREMDRMNAGERVVKSDYIKSMTSHIDHVADPESFTVEDLQNLMRKATSDLAEIDERRVRSFKQQEMRREIERRNEMKNLSPEKQKEQKKRQQEHKQKLREHGGKKVHEPGHKQNLEEIWEETDHMSKDTFNPKTFFMLHDTNGDKRLDELELEAMFVSEVDRMYAKAEETDEYGADELSEIKAEEVAKMRQYVMKEMDTNKDRAIEWSEFKKAVEKPEFENDKEWKTLGEEEVFNEEELHNYEEKLEKDMEELQRKKDKLHAFKKQAATKEATDQQNGYRGDSHIPPHMNLNVDGEFIPDFDVKLSDYVEDLDFEV